jgi:hypothetical protein
VCDSLAGAELRCSCGCADASFSGPSLLGLGVVLGAILSGLAKFCFGSNEAALAALQECEQAHSAL